MEQELVISKGNLKQDQLKGQVILVTGGGGGIGFEAARALLWLGARVVLAEIDEARGKEAEASLSREFGAGKAVYVRSDVSDEDSVMKLRKFVMDSFGRIDGIINNAAIAPTGAVHTVDISTWDKSYAVNLRGPVLLTRYFLPDMLVKKSGTMVFVPSSGAAPYLGAYEVFKTAQVELCNTLAGELAGTGVRAFSIGPGIVKTDTADAAIHKIAHLYGKTVEEFYKMSEQMLLTAEQAGTGFAAAIAMAEKYDGLEISSMQALIDCGIHIEESAVKEELDLTAEQHAKLKESFDSIRGTFEEQSEGWSKRSVFERQWVLRDFKKSTGHPPEYFIERFWSFYENLMHNKLSQTDIKKLELQKLHSYYLHQLVLLRGYEKNEDKLQAHTGIIMGWVAEIDHFNSIIAEINANNR